MNDWLGLLLIVLILLGGFFGLAHLGAPPREMTQDEFERRAAEGRGVMSAGVMAGMHALQKLLNPKAAEAVEVQKDLRAGYYDDKQQQGDGDDDDEQGAPGDADPPEPTDGEEENA
jgi:hypothetical protein